jgi:hypothetical protein
MNQNEKPKCVLIGQDGNVFNVVGRVSAALRKAGRRDLATEFTSRALSSSSYDAVLALCSEYVEVS